MNEKEYIEEVVDKEIIFYDKQAKVMKHSYYVFSIFKIVLSLIVTVLTAIVGKTSTISIIICILSSLVTLFDSINLLFRFDEKWISYRKSWEKLNKEKNLYRTNSDPYIDDKRFSNFVNSCEKIISDNNEEWEEIVSKK